MQEESNAIIKVDLQNLESSASQPQLKKLLSDGWSVFSSFPADDNGKPYLVLMLKPPTKSVGGYKVFETIIVVLLICMLVMEFYRG
jgi:hypothetical protein